MQPFASNDTYICPDCGSEVRVGARRCPGCGPFQSMTPPHPEWQEETPPSVQVNCLFTVAHGEAAEEPAPPKEQPARFSSWFMILLTAATVLAGLSLLLKLFGSKL